MLRNSNYLVAGIVSRHFDHVKIVRNEGNQVCLYDNRYKHFYVYIYRTSEKCFKLAITYRFKICYFSFRNSEVVLEFLDNLDKGRFTFYEQS